jgi:hypothetical protein
MSDLDCHATLKGCAKGHFRLNFERQVGNDKTAPLGLG